MLIIPSLYIPTPFFPTIPHQANPHSALPATPQDLLRLYQWELHSAIPSRRQEPPGLVQSFPLLFMLLNTNYTLAAEWFRIAVLVECTMWRPFFPPCHAWAWQLTAWWTRAVQKKTWPRLILQSSNVIFFAAWDIPSQSQTQGRPWWKVTCLQFPDFTSGSSLLLENEALVAMWRNSLRIKSNPQSIISISVSHHVSLAACDDILFICFFFSHYFSYRLFQKYPDLLFCCCCVLNMETAFSNSFVEWNVLEQFFNYKKTQKWSST